MDERKEKKKHIIFLITAGALLLAAAYLILCASVKTDRILPNTTVNKVSLGGMTLPDAAGALEADTDARRKNAVLTVTADGTSYPLDIGSLLELDYKALAAQSLSDSQKGFLLRGFCWLRNAILGSQTMALPSIKDLDALHNRIADAGLLEISSTVPTSYQEEDGQLVFTIGTAGTVTDEAALTRQILDALEAGDYGSKITCPTAAGILEPTDIEQIYQEIHSEPVNASLDPNNGYQITESARGVDFDREAAQKALNEASEGSTVSIALAYTEPEITTQDLKDNLFKDRLATHTTGAGGSANRIINIQLAAAKCNGVILLPGEEFSFNQTVGEQTAETGFQKANATQGEKVIQAYGGGICQVSTTLFIPALYAGLDIPERWCHTYVSSYADPGMDAAVAWGDLDFRIVNDKKYPVKLEVSYENGSLTATIWGTKTEDTPIEIETKVLDSSDRSLEVQTIRKMYSSGSENAVITRFNSSYINPSVRQD